MLKKISIGVILIIVGLIKVYAQTNADDILGTWYNQEKTSKIKIYKCGDGNKKYCGKIVWLKKDKEDDGTERIDKNNPDASKRKTPLKDLVVLKLFVYDAGSKEWNEGTIYDPYTGKVYKCYIKREGKTLRVRGYVGVSMLGRTAIWTQAD